MGKRHGTGRATMVRQSAARSLKDRLAATGPAPSEWRGWRQAGLALFEILLVLFVLSILLAIAFPAYRDYTIRARVTSAEMKGFAEVRVYFGTDRTIERQTPHRVHFSGGRAAGMNYGYADVSIPHDHRMGRLETPSLLRLDPIPNPRRHILVLESKLLSLDEFNERVGETLGGSPERRVLIFVHGYLNTFDDAARRTAQLSYDINLRGVPMFFSWPSQGEAEKYSHDSQAMEWSRSNFAAFLDSVIADIAPDNIVLVGHSMGNRGVVFGVDAVLRKRPDLASRIQEIILTAPDIDEAIFARDVAPMLRELQRPVTLYVSSKDSALELSRAFNGALRAGDSSGGIRTYPGIETIDATQVETSFEGHSYYADNAAVVSDLFYLVNRGLRPDDRAAIERVGREPDVHWRFRPRNH
jgi:esterase/lipase superfamily enzyme